MFAWLVWFFSDSFPLPSQPQVRRHCVWLFLTGGRRRGSRINHISIRTTPTSAVSCTNDQDKSRLKRPALVSAAGCTVESHLLEGEDKARFREYYHPRDAQIVIHFSSGPPLALNDSTRIKGTLTHLSMWLWQALSFSPIPSALLKL